MTRSITVQRDVSTSISPRIDAKKTMLFRQGPSGRTLIGMRSLPSLVMRGLLAAVLVSASASACSSQGDPAAPTGGLRVLFIGNSLTYVNDLPGTLSAMARSVGDTISVRSVTRPDFALIDHYLGLGGSNAMAEIAAGGWDFVVLQQGPSTVPINRDSLILTAQLFEPHIRAKGATPALYMVWPTIDRMAFFDAARISYQMAATAVNGVFMPAGEAWITAWAQDPGLVLYHADGLHPSPLGTYLVALVIYERLTGHDARLLPGSAVVEGHTLNVPETTIRLLQQAAHETNAAYPP
jgi:hypothetical protein